MKRIFRDLLFIQTKMEQSMFYLSSLNKGQTYTKILTRVYVHMYEKHHETSDHHQLF